MTNAPTGASRHLIAVDWGTSSMRAALMASDGTIRDRLSGKDGILSVPAGGYPALFRERFGPWLAAYPDARVLASGMVGSRQGWVEAPYVACPAGFEALAGGIRWVPVEGSCEVGVVPGLVDEARASPDVMRGEEVQVFGAMALRGLMDGLFVLPGTHSKWAQVTDGRIAGFRTFMTGEVYALLRHQSILGRLMPEADGPFDADAFDAGCDAIRGEGAILNALFSARTNGLFATIALEALPSYLSGLLIGEEVREALAAGDGEAYDRTAHVVLLCREDLARAYGRCLDRFGLASDWIDDTAFQGLYHLARSAGLLESRSP